MYTQFNDSVSAEVYECKNPRFLNALKDRGSFDELFATCAEVLGSRLQALMKEKGEPDTVSTDVLTQAMNDVLEYDAKNSDTLYFSRNNTLKVLMATWSKGDKVAECLGIDKESYTSMCKN